MDKSELYLALLTSGDLDYEDPLNLLGDDYFYYLFVNDSLKFTFPAS